MPSLLKTAFLALNKWAGNEYPKREDFVADNEIIDAAIKQLNDNKVSAEDVENLLTAEAILDTLKTVDGSGSGLDADTLDGKESTAFVNAVAIGSNADPNTTMESYILTNHTNSPGQALYWHVKTNFYSNKAADSNRAQTAISYNGIKPLMYIRHYYHQTGWTAWRKIMGEGDVMPILSKIRTGYMQPGALTPGTKTIISLSGYGSGKILNLEIPQVSNGSSSTYTIELIIDGVVNVIGSNTIYSGALFELVTTNSKSMNPHLGIEFKESLILRIVTTVTGTSAINAYVKILVATEN